MALQARHHAAANKGPILPRWILEHPAWAGLRPNLRWTLECMAAAGELQSDGSITAIFGGVELIRSTGWARATFWTHLSVLQAAGFVVCLGQGGTFGGKNYPNQYGIPGHPGCMDDRRCARRMWATVLDEDGRRIRTVVQPGEQAVLFSGHTHVSKPAVTDSPSRIHTGVVQNLDDVQTTSRRSCMSCIPKGSQIQHENHEASGRAPADRARRWWRVEAGDLGDVERLRDRYAEAVVRGIIENTEANWLRFMTAACHAIRVGQNNPAGLFASIVRRGQWLWLTQADEDAAIAVIKANEREWMEG
jgi:hypothetical protein